jgi:hypothetical protein
MTDLLRSIGLLKNFQLELPIKRSVFVDTLSANIDPPSADFFDIFSSGKNIYKGTVGLDSFSLKRKRKFFDGQMNLARSTGSLTQVGDKLVVDVEVNGFPGKMMVFAVMFLLVYAVAIVAMLSSNQSGMQIGFIIPFLFFHAGFMLGIPYYIMRRGVRITIYEMERDFYFMMKDKLPHPGPLP